MPVRTGPLNVISITKVAFKLENLSGSFRSEVLSWSLRYLSGAVISGFDLFHVDQALHEIQNVSHHWTWRVSPSLPIRSTRETANKSNDGALEILTLSKFNLRGMLCNRPRNHSNVYFNINVLMSHLKGWDQLHSHYLRHISSSLKPSMYILNSYFTYKYIFIMIINTVTLINIRFKRYCLLRHIRFFLACLSRLTGYSFWLNFLNWFKS